MVKGIYAQIKARQGQQKDTSSETPSESQDHSTSSKEIPQKVKEAADLAVKEAAENPSFSDNRLISDQTPSESLIR